MREPGTVERGVLFGHDSTLFLAGGDHRVLDFMLGIERPPEESLIQFAQNVTSRAATAQAASVPYLHLVFPDKHAVMAAECPVCAPVCLGDIYQAALPQLGRDLFYPRADLAAAGPGLFLKTDTHASDLGNLFAAAAVVERLTGQPQAGKIERLLAADWQAAEWSGDLGGRFEPPLLEIRRVLGRFWIRKSLHNDLRGGNNGIVDILFNPAAPMPERLLLFGDSFGRGLCSLLSYFFKEVLFLRTPYFHDEIFQQVQPDYLITENAERYLSYVHSDARRPSFFAYPYLQGQDYAPSRDFAEGFSAMLSFGRPPYFDYMAANGLLT